MKNENAQFSYGVRRTFPDGRSVIVRCRSYADAAADVRREQKAARRDRGFNRFEPRSSFQVVKLFDTDPE